MKFDVSKNKFSNLDLERGLRLPNLMSDNLAELIGIHLGDGSLYQDSNYNYNITYAGNLKKDKDYMEYIDFLFFRLFNVHMKKLIDKNKSSIELRYRSKLLFNFLKYSLKLPTGRKTNLTIPKYITNNKIYFIKFLRGLFDTDGCLIIQKYNKYKYLRIKITSKFRNFLEEIQLNLRLLEIDSYINKKETDGHIGYDVVITGKDVDKFILLIGSKNSRNINKIKKWEREDLNPDFGS